MKLVKLLSVGRSLKSGQTILGKYKLTQGSLLPKFGATFRPVSPDTFAAPTETAPARHEATSPVVLVEEAKPIVAAPAEAMAILPTPVRWQQTQKIPAGQILTRVEEVAPGAPRISLAVQVWAKFTDKIFALKQRLAPARSRRKPFSTSVQTEWSLEKVTVMRNDLSEADLEVISPKASAVLQNHKVNLPELNSVKHAGRSWIKKTAGLFKSGSPFESTAAESRQETAPVQAEKHSELADRV